MSALPLDWDDRTICLTTVFISIGPQLSGGLIDDPKSSTGPSPFNVSYGEPVDGLPPNLVGGGLPAARANIGVRDPGGILYFSINSYFLIVPPVGIVSPVGGQ